MITIRTAGESHGSQLCAIVEGAPAGMDIDSKYVNHQLARRQLGFGRSVRMKLESDKVDLISGLRFGKTLASPIAMLIENKVRGDWLKIMSVEKRFKIDPITVPRPGHADLSGMQKYGFNDLRNVLERSSARETAARVAGASVARKLLQDIGIEIYSHVVSLGRSRYSGRASLTALKAADASPVRCVDETVTKAMLREISKAAKAGDTLGGIFEVVIKGCPAGFGSYVGGDTRLDPQLVSAVVSIPGVKGAEVGDAFLQAASLGSESHDEIFHSSSKGFYRKTNHAGGVEGGITNGMDIVVRGAMKPIPTLGQPLKTVDVITKKRKLAHKERSDITAVPSAAVIAESMCALVIANSIMNKLGGDTLSEIKERMAKHRAQMVKF